MNQPQLVSVKVTEEGRRMLKVLAAHLDANLYEVVDALAHADIKKHRLKMPKKELKK